MSSPQPLTHAEVTALGDGEIVMRDGYLGEAAALAVHAEALEIVAGGNLRPARISRGDAAHRDPTLRGDELSWIEPAQAPPALAALCASFAALAEELNREAYLGLARLDVQLARYAAGAAYTRHRDAFAGERSSRVATAIYYLNPGWTPAGGGILRLHLARGPVDVEPLLDRLILFLAARVEHEVLPSHAPRLAVTAWYSGRDLLS